MKSALLAVLIALSASFGFAAAAAEKQSVVTLRDRSGAKVGTATLRESPSGVLLHVELSSFPPGTHAIHVHSVGKCEGDFESAGEHFAPQHKSHGFMNAKGPHAGDLPNLFVPANGELVVDLTTTAFSLDGSLNDADGAAIVIHERGDDYRSDPSGASGVRIACGVIGKAQ